MVNMTDYNVQLDDEASMIAFGNKIAEAAMGKGVFYLIGDLGMGKTTLSRGIILGSGHQGSVKSPTYTLVEPYEIESDEIGVKTVYHFDLYRLSDPEELEYLGIRDYFEGESMSLVEWPDKGRGFLPDPDMIIEINLNNRGRIVSLQPKTEYGQELADKLMN